MYKKNVFVIILLVLSFHSFSQTKKYIRKAENSVYKGYFQEGKDYYLKALAIDSNNYKANLGIGITMSYYLEDYDGCIPYLEKALSLSDKNDTAVELIYALGKTYHFLGRYMDAMVYYKRMLRYDEPDNEMYQPELNKRIEDCKYAIANPQHTDAMKWYVVNAGKSINTPMPEYVPVLIGNDKMIFTSKRKDDKKEKINPDNGKYFESMYISDINNGYTSNPSRYSIPQLTPRSKFKNTNESIISMMPGGKKIFIYKDQKLYEGDLSATAKSPDKVSKVINFNSYQNHAFLGETGQVLYFTSESEKGFGGNDIYRSVKESNGNWGAPENLGDLINTPFEEEAPFISADGKILYFSSNGHQGYGGYDIYKSTLENGNWSVPENLGQPINGPANDLFYIEGADGSVGYMSSSRKGGFGDMDIYKINYTDKMSKDCKTVSDDGFALKLIQMEPESNRYKFTAVVPQGIKDKILSYDLFINDSLVSKDVKEMEYDFRKAGIYSIRSKVVAWCDTCINLYIACNEQQFEIKKVYEKNDINNSGNNNNVLAGAMPPEIINYHGELSKDQLQKIGFDLAPLYFNKNDASLTSDALTILEKNKDLLKKYPDLEIVIKGYSDSRGSEGYNKHLSGKRAEEVKKFLQKYDLKNKIETIGKGETDMVNNCGDNIECDEAMHQQNRRVEFKIIKK